MGYLFSINTHRFRSVLLCSVVACIVYNITHLHSYTLQIVWWPRTRTQSVLASNWAMTLFLWSLCTALCWDFSRAVSLAATSDLGSANCETINNGAVMENCQITNWKVCFFDHTSNSVLVWRASNKSSRFVLFGCNFHVKQIEATHFWETITANTHNSTQHVGRAGSLQPSIRCYRWIRSNQLEWFHINTVN